MSIKVESLLADTNTENKPSTLSYSSTVMHTSSETVNITYSTHAGWFYLFTGYQYLNSSNPDTLITSCTPNINQISISNIF
jgi:hypothetical protein